MVDFEDFEKQTKITVSQRDWFECPENHKQSVDRQIDIAAKFRFQGTLSLGSIR